MVAITAGTGATITSPTAEGQAFLMLQWWQNMEEDPAKNPTSIQRFTGSKGTDNDRFFSGSWQILAKQEIGSTGGLIITADSYLSNLTFSPGSPPGTFKSTNPAAYLLEVLSFLMARQNDLTKNPEKNNYITGTYNAVSGSYQGQFSLPFATTMQANGTLDTPREYLL